MVDKKGELLNAEDAIKKAMQTLAPKDTPDGVSPSGDSPTQPAPKQAGRTQRSKVWERTLGWVILGGVLVLLVALSALLSRLIHSPPDDNQSAASSGIAAVQSSVSSSGTKSVVPEIWITTPGEEHGTTVEVAPETYSVLFCIPKDMRFGTAIGGTDRMVVWSIIKAGREISVTVWKDGWFSWVDQMRPDEMPVGQCQQYWHNSRYTETLKVWARS